MRDGGRIAFVVAYAHGRRVVASPSATCPNTQDTPGHYREPDVELYEQDWDDRLDLRLQTAFLSESGAFRLDDSHLPEFAGRLRGGTGQITATPFGLTECRFRDTPVHRVGPAYADGTYTMVGAPFIVSGTLRAWSGGGLTWFRTDVLWGGPPEPRITEQLGPAAGLEAVLHPPVPRRASDLA